MGCRGFTLVEMMITTGITALIAAGVFTAFIGLQGISLAAFSEAEYSVRMRELREKLLFHAAPPRSGIMWAGLLSEEGLCYDSNQRTVNQEIPLDTSAWLLENTFLEYEAGDPVDDVRYVELRAWGRDSDDDGRKVMRRERVVAPVFGTVQATIRGTGKVFDD